MAAILGLLLGSANSPTALDRQVEILFKAREGRNYVLEFKTNLSMEAVWMPLTNVPAAAERDIVASQSAFGFERYFRLTGSEEPGSLVVPPHFSTNFANTSGGIVSGPVDGQEYFNRSNFFGLPPGEIVLTGMRYRVDQDYSSIDVVIPSVMIWLSTSSKAPAELLRIRRENWGPDRQLVFSERNVRLQATRNLGNPSEFGIAIRFQNPFPYDFRAGSLLMDVWTSGQYTGRRGRTDSVLNDDGSIIQIAEGAFGEPGISYGGDVLVFEFSRSPYLTIRRP